MTRGAQSGWLTTVALEGATVALLLVVMGFFYLRPASTELLHGNASVMVGDGGDSVTNVWLYRMMLDVFESRPQDLLFGAAIYSDQMNAPEGAAHFMPWIERIFVILYSPFMKTDLMPTAMAWGMMVFSGLCFHAYGRALGWPRAVAFALATAWAFCPYTRARALVHIGYVGVYWVPLLLLALQVLARPPSWWSVRAATMAAAGMILFVMFAAHYYVVTAALMSPVFLLYYVLLLPRGASRVSAMGRLAAAVAPAALFCVWSLAVPLPSYGARALEKVVATRSETDSMLKLGGAHPTDYLLGDLKLGDRDLIPLRAKMTRKVRAAVENNRHERTNGIRWSVLACCAGLAVALGRRRFRRRLSPTERVLGGFAFVLATVAFLFSLSPQGIRIYDVDLGPIQVVAKLFPRFRVPNRIGILVHFAALLGAGVFLTRVLRNHLAARSPRAMALGAALPLLMFLDYAPLSEVGLAPVVPQRLDLEAATTARGQTCGSGMTVPYVTWGFHDEDYYKAYASLRGTSCKLLHTAYLTQDDETMRLMVGEPMFNQGDRMRAIWLARCTNASWILFRLDTPEDRKRDFCAELGWTFVTPDACGPPVAPTKPPRSISECMAETHIDPPTQH